MPRTAKEQPARATRRTKETEAPAKRSRKAAVEEAPTKRTRKVAQEEPAARRGRKSIVEEETPTKRSRKAVSEETPQRKKRSSATVEEQPAEPEYFNPYADIDATLDVIEKKAGISENTLDKSEGRMSSGNLCLDIVLGGGYTAGWYTNFGQEQCCKTTEAVSVLVSAINHDVPIIAYYDFEGSASPDYIENIMRNMGLKADVKSIFGVKDREGNYVVKPRVRYRSEAIAEKFFDFVAGLERKLPDKKKIGDQWYYLYENTKENQKLVAGKYDKAYFSKTNMYRIPAKDGSLQAMILVDSYPAMLPENKDVDDPNGAIASQARMFSEQLQRVKGRVRSKRIAILGINQLRLRPMTMGNPEYEPCFIGSTPVHLADGTVDTIRNIVLKKRKVKVLSFDRETGEISAKRVIGWKDNGNRLVSELVRVVYQAFDRHGNPVSSEFTATKEHKIWTPSGWVEAGSLQPNDTIYLNLPKDTYSSDQQQLIYGSLLGDGVFESNKRSIGWKLMYSHVRYQVPYMMWKAQALDFGDVFEIPGSSSIQRYRPMGKLSSFTSFRHYNPAIARYARLLKSNHTVYEAKHAKAILDIFEKLDLRGLAIWYMDDGHFANDRKNGMWVTTLSCDRFSDELKQAAAGCIERLTGVKPSIHPKHGKLTISGKHENLLFQEAISEYIHPSMSYKLFNCASAGQYAWSLEGPTTLNTLHKTKVLSIEKAQLGSKYARVYDLTVEDNHTYFVGGSSQNNAESSTTSRKLRADGIAVSNCGEALKLYSDVRLKHASRAISSAPYVTASILAKAKKNGGIEAEKSVQFKGEDSYRYINVRAHKNKLSRPYLEAWLRLWISNPRGEAQGFDPVFDTYAYLKQTGQMQGKRDKMKLSLVQGKNKLEAKKFIDWHEFKTLILGTRAEIKEICEEIGLKPMYVRDFCFKQMASGLGIDLYNAQLSADSDDDDGEIHDSENPDD